MQEEKVKGMLCYVRLLVLV